MKEKLNLQEIVSRMAHETGASKKETEEFLRSLFAIIPDALLRDKVIKINGLGAFKLVLVESRESVNVNTKEKYEIPARYKLSFVPDSQLKEMVNEAFSAFEAVELDENAMPDIKEEIQTDDIPGEEFAKAVAEEEPQAGNLPVVDEADTHRRQFKSKNETHRNRLWTLAGLLVVALLVTGFYYVREYGFQFKFANRTEAIVDVAGAQPTQEATVEMPQAEEQEMPEPEQKVEVSEPMKIIAKVTIEPSMTLTVIAQEYYGSKIFWVYLYMANKTRIKNPDIVPVGTIIEVPAHEVYGINVYDSASVRRANELSAEIQALFY